MSYNSYYIKSANIDVFPCSNRPDYPQNRWLTEFNLVSIVNRLVDRKSFVVSTSIPVDADDDKISKDTAQVIFNIGGYLFITDVLSIRTSLSNDSEYKVGNYVVAHIATTQTVVDGVVNLMLKPNQNGEPFLVTESNETDGLDSQTGDIYYFRGTWFTVEPLTDEQLRAKENLSNELVILKFVYVDAEKKCRFEIPADSKLKFVTDTAGIHRSVSIDDGELS